MSSKVALEVAGLPQRVLSDRDGMADILQECADDHLVRRVLFRNDAWACPPGGSVRGTWQAVCSELIEVIKPP
jgi:hypothetical protein